MGPHKYVSKKGSTIDILYLYCDIAEPGLVGDTKALLVRAKPVSAKKQFFSGESSHYVELLKLNYSPIEIGIRNDLGGEVTFLQSGTLVKLDLRPNKR